MTARDVAREMRAWAITHGMLDRERPASEEAAQQFQQRLPAVNWGAASEILQKRKISFIGFNEPNNEVVVYTTSNVTKAQKQLIPDSAGDTKIIYKKSNIAGVGGPTPPAQAIPFYLHNNRYTCGSSVYVGNAVGAGTLGALVTNENGILFGLSNNHITGMCNYAEAGLPILAPGAADVRPAHIDPFTIGHHFEVGTFVDGSPDNVDALTNTDAALFGIKVDGLVSSMQRNIYDTPSDVADIEHNMVVQKVGRTTGLTQGVVRVESAGPEPVEYTHPELGVNKVVYFDPMFIIEGTNIPFAAGGDSGSLITVFKEGDKRYAVGIVVAVSKDGSQTFALPIRTILEYFGVGLLSNHNI